MKMIILILSCLLLANCATVIRLPSSTGQTPVVGGELGKGKVGIDLSASIPITIINDITTTPPTRNTVRVGEDDNLIGSAIGIDAIGGSRTELSIGLLERMDIYYTGAFGVRYMIFGQPQGLGWRATLFGGMVSYGETDSSDSNTISANTKISAYEFGTSIGKQWHENRLVYLTLASRGGDADITVDNNGTTTGDYQDEFDHYMATVGLLFGQSWFLKVEVSANHIEWRGETNSGGTISDSNVEYGTTVGLGFRW